MAVAVAVAVRVAVSVVTGVTVDVVVAVVTGSPVGVVCGVHVGYGCSGVVVVDRVGVGVNVGPTYTEKRHWVEAGPQPPSPRSVAYHEYTWPASRCPSRALVSVLSHHNTA